MRYFAVPLRRYNAAPRRRNRRSALSDQQPQRLESWKDIAAYLRRDVSTVQRWEKREGMPVHRHQHDKLGSVYAFTAELDAWAQSRRASPEAQPEQLAPTPRHTRPRLWLIGLAVVVVLGAVAAYLATRKPSSESPLANARFTRLTDFEGTEQAATISRDGRFVAFLSDRDGAVDVWVTQIGTGQFHNLTRGKLHELVNPDIRLLTFSPDGARVGIWVRKAKPGGGHDISIWSIPTLGGEPRLLLEGAAELEWSADGKRLVYHTPAPGDPMFVRDGEGGPAQPLFTGSAGVHNHYQVWSPDDRFVYFVHGPVPQENDAWRIAPSGGRPERMTRHGTRVTHPAFLNSRTLLYLATEADGSGPWLYALDPERRVSRRVSFGVERYTSLAASADGRRLVVTVANPRRTLWRVPIGDTVSAAKDAARVHVPIAAGRAPRSGPGYLLFVSQRGDADSIWKLAGGTASELWTAPGARLIGGPAITADGRRIAFTAEERGKRRLYVMGADGSEVRAMPESLAPRGEPAWSPDGQSIAVADGASRLVVLSVASRQTRPVVADFAANPAWSHDGGFLVYSGREVGTTFPIRAVGNDGRARAGPQIMLSRGIRRVAFLPGRNELVVLRGDISRKDFWAIDLTSGAERRLTDFGPEFVIGDFDVSPDGKEIVFDREQDSGDIVLIERTGS